MNYDVLKYHIVTTVFHSKKRQDHIREQFKTLNNNQPTDVNFYFANHTKKYNLINFDQKKCKLYSSLYRQYTRKYCGWVGCITGLLGAINIAKNLNWPYLFIFEDDVKFEPLFNKKINIYANSKDFGMLVLGYRTRNITSIRKINNYLIQPNGCSTGGYAFLINASYFDNILNTINDKDIIDVRDTIYFQSRTYSDIKNNIYFLNDKIVSLSSLNNFSTIQTR